MLLIRNMDSVYLSGLVVTYIRVNISRMRDMAQVRWAGLMVLNILESGGTEYSMVMEKWSCQMELSKKATLNVTSIRDPTQCHRWENHKKYFLLCLLTYKTKLKLHQLNIPLLQHLIKQYQGLLPVLLQKSIHINSKIVLTRQPEWQDRVTFHKFRLGLSNNSIRHCLH